MTGIRPGLQYAPVFFHFDFMKYQVVIKGNDTFVFTRTTGKVSSIKQAMILAEEYMESLAEQTIEQLRIASVIEI